jgi:hypothetical protein
VTINQDAKAFVAELKKGDQITYDLGANRYGWLHVIHGGASVNETALKTGDLAVLSAEKSLRIVARSTEPTGVLLFDLA